MGVYLEATEITGLYFGDTEITGLYFGDTEIWAAWAEYDGTLPATYRANGDYLVDYRIYGAAGGVGDDNGTEYGYEVDMSVSNGMTSTTTPIYIGDEPLSEDEYISYSEQKVYRRTENQFYGDFINGSLTSDGYIMSDTRIVSENYIKIDALQNTLSITPQIASLDTIVFYYDNNETYLGNSADNNTGWKSLPFIFSAPNSTKYVRVVFRYHDNSRISPNAVSNVMLNTGKTAKTYAPYYDPQNPPVPLPALPTVDGTTITDYAGQSAAPSRFYAKYKKG